MERGKFFLMHVLGARTLVQPGRFLYPMEDEHMSAVNTKWRSAPLLKKPLVEEATLTHTRDLLVIEDVSPESLPVTTEVATNINPPEKHQQIGVDAGRKMLRGFLQGLEPPTGSRCAVLIVDMSLRTAEILKAAATDHLLSSTGLSTYYMGFAAGEEKLEWAIAHFETWATERFLVGSLPLPKSVSLPPAELPGDMVEAAPPQPSLNVLTWNTKVKFSGLATLKTPSALLQKYHDHQRFATEFQAILETARQELPLDMVADESSSNKGGHKRPVTFNTETGMVPPEKKKKEESGAATPASVKLEAEQYHMLTCFLVHVFWFVTMGAFQFVFF